MLTGIAKLIRAQMWSISGSDFDVISFNYACRVSPLVHHTLLLANGAGVTDPETKKTIENFSKLSTFNYDRILLAYQQRKVGVR